MSPALAALLPLDKYWHIRMGVLDLLNGKRDTVDFLREQPDLGEDLRALLSAGERWPTEKEISVGEAGTLYRFLRFAAWKLGLDKTFIREGTLRSRPMCDDPSIVSWPQRQLLTLDHSTSQWASAAALLGDAERLPDAPFHLKVTYEAIDHWNDRLTRNERWEPRRDETIRKQAEAFLGVLGGSEVRFIPEQPDDYCFARAFNLVTPEEGEHRWPMLRGHESDRIAEMEKALGELERSEPISSRDHRVVQAVAMLGATRGKSVSTTHPDCVAKTWPQFWKFLNAGCQRP